MFALSFTVATAQEVVTCMADVGAGAVKRWGGRVLIGVGLWLVVLAVGANLFARFFPVHRAGSANGVRRGLKMFEARALPRASCKIFKPH